jgi:predicted flap endonuclease-1-like 5' DNA nuclease
MTATGVVVETAPMPLIEAGAGVVAAGSALGTGLAGATGGTSLDDEPVPVIQPAGEAAAASAAAADAVGDRPRGLVAARDGRADDLKRIKGIGPQNEARLNALGIWHFDQIAAWTPANSRWVGAFLAFPGRIEREHWLDQAAVLATGGMTEFAKRVDKGDLHYGAVDRAEQTRIIAEMRHDIETGVKPVGLPAPRGGQGDDLTAITGIGPAIAKLLNEAGIWHFDQLATLTPAEVHWIEHFVGYPGRAEREGWIEEAKDYAGMS